MDDMDDTFVKNEDPGAFQAFDFSGPPQAATNGTPVDHHQQSAADLTDSYQATHEHDPPEFGDEGDCKRPRLRLGAFHLFLVVQHRLWIRL